MSDAELIAALRRRLRRVLIGGGVLLLLLLFAARANDVLSCQRQQHPRQTLRAFISSNAEFQRGLAAFDSTADRQKHAVTLNGHVVMKTRAGLRVWVAREWDAQGLRVKPPDCGGIFPTDK